MTCSDGIGRVLNIELSRFYHSTIAAPLSIKKVDFKQACITIRIVGEMAILQQLSCESSTRSTLFQFREGVSGKRNKPHNTAIVRPNELRGLDLSL